MKKKLFTMLLALCLVFCIAPLSVSALTDIEENGSIATAQKLTIGETIEGACPVDEDEDYFAFTLSESGRVTFDMMSYMPYYSLGIFDSTGTGIWYHNGNEWNASVGFRNDVWTADLEAGTYYLRIDGCDRHDWGIYRSSTGTYVLKTSFTSAKSNEKESNDSILNADTMPLNGTFNGQIACNGRYDFHKITLKQSGRITLDITSYMQYYSLYLYDANGNQLWYDDGNEWNSNVGFRNDVYSIDLTGGDYYLKVTGYRYDTYDASTGNYTIKTSFTPANATEQESNNSFADANVIGLYDTVVGQIAVNDEYDIYRIEVPQDRRIWLDVVSYMEYFKFEYYDASGNSQGKTENQKWNEIDRYEGTWYMDVEAGTYYIKVTGNGSTGTYQITFNKLRTPKVTISNDPATGKPKLDWGSVLGATKYQIWRSTSKNGKYTLMKTVSDTTYINKTAKTGTRYYYKVIALDGFGGKSVASNKVYRMADLPQPVVTSSNVASTGRVKLTWKAIDGAVKYKIFRQNNETGKWVLMNTVTGTTYINKTSKPGVTYNYKVVAVAENTNANSAPTYVTGTGKLAKVTNLKATNEAETGYVKLTWDKVSGANYYAVYRSTSKNGTYECIGYTAGNYALSSSGSLGTRYYYKIEAWVTQYDTVSNSVMSAAVTRTRDLPRPEVIIWRNAKGKPVLEWEAVNGATKYQVYRSTSKNGEYSLIMTTKNTKFTNTGAKAGVTYYYKVVAVYGPNTNSNSAFSKVVSIKAK